VRTREVASFELALEDAIRPGYRLACGMLHDPPAAEDVVQDAAIKAWRKRHQLREGSPLLPWFLAIVANECRNHFRRRWALVLRQASVPVEVETVDLDTGVDLRRELMRLPSEDRLVVVLHFHLDMSLDEIAAVTGRSPAAVRGRLYRAIRKLRVQMTPQEVYR
jgi:RNA polymerase sigma-70 factor (ECF subfamily)